MIDFIHIALMILILLTPLLSLIAHKWCEKQKRELEETRKILENWDEYWENNKERLIDERK